MYSKFAIAAGLVALAGAAPVPQAQETSTNWSSIWSSQLASMDSVLSAMGQPTGGANATPTGSSPAVPTGTGSHTGSRTGSQTAQVTPSVTPSQPGAGSSPSPTPTSTSSSGGNTQTRVSGAGQGPAVTNSAAWNGQSSGAQVADGQYKCFASAAPAKPANFPQPSAWGSFDNLWTINQKLLTNGCTNLGLSPDNTETQNGYMKDAIQQVASDAKVDPRFIFAIILQESNGCLVVGSTNNGVTNPGIMQSHNGASFVGASASADQQKASIVQMIRDGTQGTASGDGLVQLINKYGDVWSAARGYNSGSIAADGNLDNGNGATKTYVESVANRLEGWSYTPGTPGTCPAEV